MALIAAATLLPFGAIPAAQMPPRWCFDCGGMWFADAISNVLLFVPFGLALALQSRKLALIACSGAVLSLAVELSQSVGFPPSRSPAIADIVANALGAVSGWMIWRFWHLLSRADARQSAGLAGAWWLMAVSILSLTVAAEKSRQSGTPTTVGKSSIDYAPGLGWYGGTPIDARVTATHDSGPWTISHIGTGPIVASADRGAGEWHVDLRSSGLDSAGTRRAMFFLHVAGDTTAELLIAQHGHDVDLIVRRRAWSWGLNFPVISAAGLFDAQSPNDTVLVEANASNRLVQLEGRRGARSERVQIALTPVLGWTMLQTLVGVQHPLAWLIQMMWLTALFFPFAWWSGRTRSTGAIALSVVGIAATLSIVAPVTGAAPFSLQDLLSVMGIWAAGAALGWTLASRYPGGARG